MTEWILYLPDEESAAEDLEAAELFAEQCRSMEETERSQRFIRAAFVLLGAALFLICLTVYYWRKP